jgi:hypothetical protein
MRGAGQRMRRGNGKLALLFEVQEVREAEAEGQEGAPAVLDIWQVNRAARQVVEAHRKQDGVEPGLEGGLGA